jgi:hypothetical protein
MDGEVRVVDRAKVGDVRCDVGQGLLWSVMRPNS